MDSNSLQSFEHQMGGHDKLLSLNDNSIVVKPCNGIEKEFYEVSALHPKFAKWIPKYFGHLTLQGYNSALAEQITEDANIPPPQTIKSGIEEHNANITGVEDIL